MIQENTLFQETQEGNLTKPYIFLIVIIFIIEPIA